MPVGIFVDLDNIHLLTHSRKDAAEFILPLQRFADKVGQLSTFQGFGNLSTRSFRSPEEGARLRSIDNWSEYDPERFHTGRDKNGILRCGVCGAKMRLSKKRKARGISERDLLDKHMQLHSNEETKRQNKRKHVRLNTHDVRKSRKYKAALLDYRWPGNRNQLFAVLREQGVVCRPCSNVDAELIESAIEWTEYLGAPESSNDDDSLLRGCLVVYSRDSDFSELLQVVRSWNVLTVTVTQDSKQTRSIEAASDLVLTFGGKCYPEAYSHRGFEFLRNFEAHWYDKASSGATASDEDDNEDFAIDENEQLEAFSSDSLDRPIDTWWRPKEDGGSETTSSKQVSQPKATRSPTTQPSAKTSLRTSQSDHSAQGLFTKLGSTRGISTQSAEQGEEGVLKDHANDSAVSKKSKTTPTKATAAATPHQNKASYRNVASDATEKLEVPPIIGRYVHDEADLRFIPRDLMKGEDIVSIEKDLRSRLARVMDPLVTNKEKRKLGADWKLAVRLHYAEKGIAMRYVPQAPRISTYSGTQARRKLRSYGLDPTGNAKVVRKRLLKVLIARARVSNIAQIRKVLVQRGLSDKGDRAEITARLVNSVGERDGEEKTG